MRGLRLAAGSRQSAVRLAGRQRGQRRNAFHPAASTHIHCPLPTAHCRLPAGERRYCPTPWTDRLTFTSSPTRKPPISSGAFHIRPKSLRLSVISASKPTLLVAPGILRLAEVRHRQRDLLRDAADRQVADHVVAFAALLDDPLALEGDVRELLDVEEVGRAQVRVAIRLVGVDARRLDRELDRRELGLAPRRAGSCPRNRRNGRAPS